jgi:hypothetical protein
MELTIFSNKNNVTDNIAFQTIALVSAFTGQRRQNDPILIEKEHPGGTSVVLTGENWRIR